MNKVRVNLTTVMIKDLMLRIIFIPVLGIGLPFVSGIISYSEYSIVDLLATHVFFILVFYCIWTGSNWIHEKLRPLYQPIANPFSKTCAVATVSALYGACTGGLSALIWFRFSREVFSWSGINRFVAVCAYAVLLLTLIYEIIFLTKERDLDTKIVGQLDKERSQAELQALTNEMDPHFLFNSLNTLNYLILNDPPQAYLFNNKLSQVYKYFLLNKSKELIPLKEELEFIGNYFYLLQIRHDDKLQLQIALDSQSDAIMLPPCSLQILVENAIKHNAFTEQLPLRIKISLNEQYLNVSNNAMPKPYSVTSTHIGLKNLRARYRILFHKEIQINNSQEHFTVSLPLIA